MIAHFSIRAPEKRNIWTMVAVGVWCLAFAVTCGAAFRGQAHQHTVFPVFAHAGQSWINGSPLYQRSSATEFRYSPIVAAAFAPFKLFPNRLGEFCWRALNFAALMYGLWLCCAAEIPRKLSETEIAALFLLIFPMAIGSLNNAQSNPLVLGLLLMATAWVIKEKWNLAAVAITVATLFKLYPIAYGLLLVLIYPKKMGWRIFAFLAIGAGLPYLLQHHAYVSEQYRSWVTYLFKEDRAKGSRKDWYRDLRAVWRIYIGPMSKVQYLLIELSAAFLIAVIALAGRLRRLPMSVLLTGTLSLACCWMVVLGPSTESSTYILLAPALAWAVFLAETDEMARFRRIAYELLLGLFLACNLALNVPHGDVVRDRLQLLAVSGLLMMGVMMVDEAVKVFRQSAPG